MTLRLALRRAQGERANNLRLKYLGTGQHHTTDHGSRAYEGMVANEAAHVDTGVDAGLNTVSDDSAKLTPPGVDISCGDFFLIQPQVCNLGASAEVALLPYYAITYIVVMGYFAAPHNYRVLDLYRATYVAVVADGGAGADVAIGTYIAVIPDYHRPLNI